MKEIKFRAFKNWWFHYYTLPRFSWSWDIDLCDAKVSQYTWLKDKNGNEIYEGDQVEINTFEHWKIRRVVIYDAPSFYLSPNKDERVNVMSFSTPNIHETIIGNIFENPFVTFYP